MLALFIFIMFAFLVVGNIISIKTTGLDITTNPRGREWIFFITGMMTMYTLYELSILIERDFIN